MKRYHGPAGWLSTKLRAPKPGTFAWKVNTKVTALHVRIFQASGGRLSGTLDGAPLLVLHHIAGDGWSLAPLSRDLGAAYRADRWLLPPDWQRGGGEVEQLRTIGDFIAGMTDRFAIARHEEIVGPVNLPADRF